MVELSRNASCPCGSGKKYKQCCLKSGRSFEIDEEGNTTTTRNRLIWIILAVGLAVGAGAAAMGGPALGISTFGVFILVIGLILIFRNPPPPHEEWKDPAAM